MTDHTTPPRSGAGNDRSDSAGQVDDIIDVEVAPVASPPPEPPARPSRLPVLVAGALAVGALAVSAVVWQRLEALRLDAGQWQQQASRSSTLAQQAMDELGTERQARGTDAQRIASLDAELQALRTRQDSTDQAFQLLVDRGSDHMLLNDVEHLALIAQQQLRLGGHVSNAIISLETAQAQLVRAGRPQFALLLQAINGDLDRLRAAAPVDLQALSARLDRLEQLLASAPQVLPERVTADPSRLSLSSASPRADASPSTAPAAPVTPDATEGQPWWQQAWAATASWTQGAWSSVRQDLGSFVSVRRVDDATALLLSPDQADRLRDQLRLRVLTARLALLTNQPEVWKTELEAVARAVAQRFDMQAPVSRQAEQLVLALAGTSIDAQLPTVEQTLLVVQQLRAESEGDNAASSEAEAPAEAGDGASASQDAPAAPEQNESPAGDAAGNGSAPASPAADAQAAPAASSGNGAASPQEAGLQTSGAVLRLRLSGEA